MMIAVQTTQSKTKAACGLVGLALFTLIFFSNTGVLRGADPSTRGGTFLGTKAGEEITVGGIQFCWCPAGKFIMGSPPNEPERRPDEDQVAVTLTKGFWMAKFETTQGQWKKVIGELPGPLTEELPKGD